MRYQTPVESVLKESDVGNNLVLSNVTSEELLISQKEILQGSSIKVNGKPVDTSYAYIFFDGPGDIWVPLGYQNKLRMPVKMDSYGFPYSRTVRLDRRGRATGFSPEAERVYQSLFEYDEVPLNEVLESIGVAVNSSIRYDFDELERSEKIKPNDKEIILKSKETYQPRGDETVEGICTEAGQLIRTLLGYALRDPTIRYTAVSTQGDVIFHDVTLVFDIQTGNWTVVNSKSPLKPYNLVPRERLEKLGRPFRI